MLALVEVERIRGRAIPVFLDANGGAGGPLGRRMLEALQCRPVIQGGAILMGSAGSQAVRNVIERYQPLIALHGHIHESRGTVKIGKTVCINPGSAYGEGVLHGALFELDARKGLKRYQLTSG